MSYTYKYARPALTVDAVVFGLDPELDNLDILLIQRDGEPFKGSWALPGGFVHLEESLEEAVKRELAEETGMRDIYLEQLYTFGRPGRDPRERVVSVAYYGLVKMGVHRLKADTDARDVAWFSIYDMPELAFDHKEIVQCALERLRGKLSYQPIGFELLPEKFTLSQLQQLYEIVLETKLDKRNFRKKLLSMGMLEELDELERGVSHRAARLYRFDKAKYDELVKDGFNFKL